MRNIFEQWNSFQINEGALEKETTEISRDIVQRFKKLVSAGTIHQSPQPFHWIEPAVPESLEGFANITYVQVKIIVLDQSDTPHAKKQRKAVRINGQYASNKQELTLFMYLSLDAAPTPEDLIKSINEWLPELKELLRHEIEHARQKTKATQGKGEYTATGGGSLDGNRQEAIEYFQKKEEKEAYVAGLYKRAKTTKKPFKELFDDWISGMRFKVLMIDKGAEEFPDSEVQKAFQGIERDYIEYAKRRFPAAQGIQEGWRRYLHEVIELDIEVGDIVLGGKFKNKRTVVKSIGTDDLGQPTINGKSLLKFRIEKQLPAHKKSKKTQELEKEEETEE